MYQKIHRWVDEDSVDVEPEDGSRDTRDPQDREEREIEELPGEKRRLTEIAEE
jgi:hypothetical protein